MKIQFLRDTARPILPDLPRGTLVIHRDGFGYGIPEIPGAEYMEFMRYRSIYSSLNPPAMVIIGLNRIITPSNRCDMVNEYLQTMTPSTPKICLDTAPFIGEPWRIYYHYDVANVGKFPYQQGYACESDWQSWFYRDIPTCRLAAENIRLMLSDTISDLPLLNTSIEFYDISSIDEQWYEEAKKHVFSKNTTPKTLINALLAQANRHFDVTVRYDLYLKCCIMSLPDVGVYRFVAEEAMRRMKIYNEVVKYGRENLPH